MPDLTYGTTAYQRSAGSFPPLECENLRLVKADTSQNQVALLSRFGLAAETTRGAGPIQRIFVQPGTLGGDEFTVSGKSLYRGDTLIGAMADLGDGPVSIAGSDSEILIAGGGDMYRYDGTSLGKVTFPDSASVRWVLFIGSLFVAGRGDGAFPGRWYFSDVLDGSSWPALNFATNEREADETLDAAPLGDNIWFFGQATVEAWQQTGDPDLPFTRIEQVAFDKGILQPGCVCEADNSLYFVGSDARLYRIGEVPQRVSSAAIEEKIAAATTVSLFSYLDADGEYVTVRLEGNDLTYEHNIASQSWAQLTSGASGGQWIARTAAMNGNTARFGHASTGAVMQWSGWADLADTLTRRFTAAAQSDKVLVANNVWCWVNSGASGVLTGQGSDPKMEIRLSRDAGETWTDWNDSGIGNAGLGGQGQYRVVPEWRRLGQFDPPGIMLEGRVTDPVPFRLSAVKINEPVFGRSRG